MRQTPHSQSHHLPAMSAGLSRTAFDEATYRQTLVNWELEVVQLSQGEISGESRQVSVEGLHVLQENFRNVTLNQYGSGLPGSFVFGLPLHVHGEARHNGRKWSDEIFAFRGEAEIDAVLPPMDLLSLVVDRQLLCDYAMATEHVDLEHWLSRQALMIDDKGICQELSRAVYDVLAGCFDAEVDLSTQSTRRAIRHSILEAVTPVIVRHLNTKAAPVREFNRSMIVRKAREHALDHITEPLQVIDLCQAVGVSRRALQQGFQEVLGTNPVAYLRMLRLSGARQMLLNAPAQT